MSNLIESLSLNVILLIFCLAAVLVWLAGTKLSGIAGRMADQTKLGSAVVGILVLGGITSLPEIVTTVTASLKNQPEMVVSNLTGGIALQVTLIALADVLARKRSVTAMVHETAIVYQGIGSIIMLAIIALAVLFPGFSMLGIGPGSILLVFVFIQLMRLSYKLGDQSFKKSTSGDTRSAKVADNNKSVAQFIWSANGVWLLMCTLLIITAGYAVVVSAEVIAQRTGIGNNITGYILLAITTSLPEISTVVNTVRMKRYSLVISNIFGTNLFDAVLVFPADVLYRDNDILNSLGTFTVAGSLLAILITAVFISGILHPVRKKYFNLGWDSICGVLTYLAGIWFLFKMDG